LCGTDRGEWHRGTRNNLQARIWIGIDPVGYENENQQQDDDDESRNNNDNERKNMKKKKKQ